MIHNSSIIEDGASIGENVSIGAFSYIGSNVIIGDNTTIGNNVSIEGKTTIGKNNKIYSYAFLGSDPQDLKFDGEDSELIIGDNNTFREFSSINKGTQGGGNKTIFGNNNLIMSHVHIGHDCIFHNNCIVVSGCVLGGHIELENNVILGGATGIHQFVKIGEYAMTAGGSVLVSDLPSYCICEGNRASLRGLNITGIRRHLKSHIDPLKRAYKEIFTSGNSMREIAKEIIKNADDECVIKLSEFVVNTKRGIVKRETRKKYMNIQGSINENM